MTWFQKLTGFPETSAKEIRAKLELDGFHITSKANGRTYDAGRFSTPALQQLRTDIELPFVEDAKAQNAKAEDRRIAVSQIVADVRALHQDHTNSNAVFQVASQFNCLEMVAPHVSPEDGIGIYQNDLTQGPTCCICAGAGTIYRNYFANVNGQLGQTSDCQIDCLAGIGRHFGNAAHRHWQMQNGYCFPTIVGLKEVEQQLAGSVESQLNEIRGKLRVGVQSQTEVTVGESNHLVTQVFCSALPIAYSRIDSHHWNHFPRLSLIHI